MAGVKGRSGGARPNSGGARAGAGRKPKAASKSANGGVDESLEPQAHGGALKRKKAEPAVTGTDDPLDFLRQVWRGDIDATATQVRAAASALPFVHKKLGEGGKKEQRQDAANKVAGRFAAAAPPRLASVGGRKV